MENNQLAFSVAEEHLGINPLLKPEEMNKPDKLALLSYLSLFYELFLDTEPAPPSSSEEGEVGTMEGVEPVSTPVSGGKDPKVEASRSFSEERKDSKKKRRRSIFRMGSRKKLLGASPSSAERLVFLYCGKGTFQLSFLASVNASMTLLLQLFVVVVVVVV